MSTRVGKHKQQQTFWTPRDTAIRDVLGNEKISDSIKERLLKQQIAKLQATWTDEDYERHSTVKTRPPESLEYRIDRVAGGAWNLRTI